MFHGSGPFVKREGNENFDVPMGCFDGAEVRGLVETYIKPIKYCVWNMNVGVYRDDGFEILWNLSVPGFEKKTKALVHVFKKVGYQ